LIVTLVLLAALIVIRARLVVTVMIVLVGLIVMLLVGHRVVIVMTGLVRLIVTLVLLAALIVIRALHALQRKNGQMKLRVALANVAQAAKCHCRQNVLVKIG